MPGGVLPKMEVLEMKMVEIWVVGAQGEFAYSKIDENKAQDEMAKAQRAYPQCIAIIKY